MDDVEYNERFWWRSTGEMTSAFKQALYQGAPFPIVSLAEYFSLHQEGFSWGSKYRQAGYYASLILWYNTETLSTFSHSLFIQYLGLSLTSLLNTLLQDIICLLDHDESTSSSGTKIRSIRNDHHRYLHVNNEPNLLGAVTL